MSKMLAVLKKSQCYLKYNYFCQRVQIILFIPYLKKMEMVHNLRQVSAEGWNDFYKDWFGHKLICALLT